MKKHRGIIWFRQDLRLHDNEALRDAALAVEELLPIYVFDERLFTTETNFGFRKTDVFRAAFILDAVHDLRNNLRSKGSDLVVRFGKPEDILLDFADNLKSSYVFCNRERTQEELEVQDVLENNLWTIGQEVRYSRGKMLYYTADLPFPVTHTPDKFSTFRKEVEKIVSVRKPLESEQTEMGPLPVEIEVGDIPSFEELGYTPNDIQRLDSAVYKGGETEGLARLKYYLWESDLVASYKKTRNQMLGSDFSSKFSPYLAQGCLSPKKIYDEVKKYEDSRQKNESTYWIFFELLWRDFFRLMGKKHGNNIFKKCGTKGVERPELENNLDLFKIWSEGRTGIPIVDANMIELNTTGFMSNRGRQNVASYLINDLKVNWQIGAEYFESLLIDYDPCSNYGNWNYVAGVGSDPRENRYFNTTLQAKKYDPEGEYVKAWIPALNKLPAIKVHEPFLLTDTEQITYDFVLGKHYPKPIIRKPDLGVSY